MAELTPEPLDQLRSGIPVLRKRLVDHLAEDRAERVHLTNAGGVAAADAVMEARNEYRFATTSGRRRTVRGRGEAKPKPEDGAAGGRGAPSLGAYRSNPAFEFELDPLFGQSWARGVALLPRGVVCCLPVVVAGRFDFELPSACANATPPPAMTAAATANARMRVMRVIPPPFDAGDHESSAS